MAYQFNNEVLNAILLDLGGTTTYPQDIDVLNAILLQLGGTGGHHYMIDAYNELCTIQSVSSNHYYLIDALNAINIGGGGTAERFELPALVQLGANVNQPLNLFNKATAGGHSEDYLLSDFIPVEALTRYDRTNKWMVYYYYANKAKFFEDVPADYDFLTPADTAFIKVFVGRTSVNTFMLLDYGVSKAKYLNYYRTDVVKFHETSDFTTGFNQTGFTLTNGLASATAATSMLVSTRDFISDNRTLKYKVKMAADAVIGIGTTMYNNNTDRSTALFTTYCVIDCVNKLLKVIKTGADPGGVPNPTTVLASAAIAQTLNATDDYIIELKRLRKVTTLKLTNNNTGVIDTVSWNGSIAIFADGAGNHRPYYCIELHSGASLSVSLMQVYGKNYERVVFLGDSITEASGRADTTGIGFNYAEKLITFFKDNGQIVACQGMPITGAITALTNEVIYIKPKYLVVTIGTNDSATEAHYNTIKTWCTTNGVTLVLNHVPCFDAARTPTYQDINAVIDLLLVDGAKFDIATAVGGVPANGYDVTLFKDTVHPNQLGNNAMYTRFKADIAYV